MSFITPVSWTTFSMSQCQFWFDTSDPGWLAVSSGNIIGWGNKGIASSCNFQTASADPTYVTNTLNGRPIARFTPNQYFTIANSSGIEASASYEQSVFYVARIRTSGFLSVFGKGYAPLNYLSDRSRAKGFYIHAYRAGGDDQPTYGNYTNFPDTYSYDTWYILSICTGVSEQYVSRNGHAVLDSTDRFLSYSNIADWHVGSVWEAQYEPSNLDLAELILFTRYVEPVERRKIEFYLSRKWGIDIV